jgi:valyl-tRNA synthetase
MINEKAERHGNLLIAMINAVRRDKAEKRMPLNTLIKKLTIYAGNAENAESLHLGKEDLAGTCKAENIEILPERGKGKTVEGYEEITFKAEYQS